MNKIISTLAAVLLGTFVINTASAGGDAAAGESKAVTCVGCHGPNGVSSVSIYPVLAGQYENYLYRALIDYKSGERKNPIMAGMVAGLTEEDMKNLAAYYAAQGGPLTFVHH
ncbi:MAG: cytochrome c [Chromatiales bacterium]|nr:cytochrome c [Chromatiales bacterium]